ncbi:hypothetical protein VB715_18795 [Crocosphaera sp. UHCC 0190]|uniref:hypothetical protein n=1 Tax=Crocosphaera sp. UHCC 0190 TaxID=3110246 RepID=UPI002B20D027|nr:hypothetical protein [Crocosphaera sp. UHCC 0190]MEA5511824.1 hypothetical protein [Crocosphaera sp. UHCC 0190]
MKLTIKNCFLTVVLFFVLSLTSCGQLRNNLTKVGSDVVTDNFSVQFYSGGKLIREYQIYNGFVSEEVESDGWFFRCRGELVRLSGNVIIEPLSFSQGKGNSISCKN